MCVSAIRVGGVVLVAASVLLASARDACAVLKVAAGGAERTVDASCQIQPDASGDPFFQQVQDCLDEIKALGKDGMIKDLIASGNTHKISKTNGGSKITWGNNPAALQNALGVPGAGSGTRIQWNPTNKAFPNGYTEDGTPRDPCGAFLHELVHSHDADNGLLRLRKMNTTPGGAPDKVLVEEVRACQIQNWMAEAKGMPSRTTYGERLPPGLLFDRCPDCLVLFFVGGFTLTIDEVVYEVPVAGLGIPNYPGMNVPGRSYEIKNGAGTVVGHVTLIKDLDGRIRFRLTAALGQAVTLTNVQFKNNGANVGANIELDSPLAVDAVAPSSPTEATSGPVTPPSLGALRLNKCGDDQSVAQGAMITWKIKITNIGSVPLMNISVVDSIPGCNFMLANLAVGATHEQECTVAAGGAPGEFVNQAQAQGTGPNNEIARSRDVARYTVKAP